MTINAAGYQNIFEDVGEFVQRNNQFLTLAKTTLPAYELEIDGQLTTNLMYELLSGVPEIFIGFQDTVVGWIGQMTGKCTQRFTDRETVVDNLPLELGAGITAVLLELYRDMVDNGGAGAHEDLNASVAQVDIGGGATTFPQSDVLSDAVGDSDGVVLIDNILDGVTAPGQGWPVEPGYLQDLDQAAATGRWPGDHANYVGTPSELIAPSDPMTLTCTSDSEAGGVVDGSETFSWVGELSSRDDYDWRTEGSGAGPSVGVMNGAGILTNGEFEDFTSDLPDSWDEDAGSAGTEILEETTTVKRGSSALEFKQDGGAEATIQISQTLATSLTPGKRYVVGLWVQGTAGIAAGVLRVQFEGTDYVPGSAEYIEMNAAALAAQVAYGVEFFFVNMPLEMPSDMKLVIKITGTLTDTKSVYFDGLALAEVTWHGGVGVGILAGEDVFLNGDRFTFTLSSTEGVFQQFMRRAYKHQLPSVTDGSETIDDALATD